ncbi:MAG: RES family NAD+ phosphorylase [Gammaproteobacteria bacterium]|nr:RES family NAD+ phosphorylase [Gammaproteobacteria bacterium]
MPQLPEDWRTSPPISHTRELGNDWLKQKRSLLLQIPSAVSPVECNYLINPDHPDFACIEIAAAQPYSFDSRLLKLADG